MTGRVFLVGAGPGDPGLLTLHAARLLGNAEVIVLDALVSPEIRALISPAAEIIDAGKRASNHTMSQEETNALLVDLGSKGKRVVRLKGGDPFVFGRGGEEAEALARAGVPFEIIPGISSALAGPAYAGIPVTHRSLATSFTVVTGHESDQTSGVDWASLAATSGTLVFLMGLSNIGKIAQRLMANGRSSDTSVAVIASATTPRQRTVSGTLQTIERDVTAAALQAPALIVVGEVVSMREQIAWFEKRPLFGRKIVVTRAREQASRLSEMIEEAGGEALQFPMIEIVDPPSWDSVDAAISSIERYDWLVFSSTNGVERFLDRLMEKRDSRALSKSRIAAVGRSTAEVLKKRGILADVVPERFQSNALLPHFQNDLSGQHIAVIRAERGNDEFLEALRGRGADVDLLVTYQTRAASERVDELRELLRAGKVDAVTFTSGSTVENFFELMAPPVDLGGTIVASIGPQTSAVLRRFGIDVDVESEQAEIEALFDVLVSALVARMTAR